MVPGSIPLCTGHPIQSIGPWGLMLEAVVDLVRSIISESRGGSAIPIRGGSDPSPVSTSVDGTIDIHLASLTPDSSSIPIVFEADYHRGAGTGQLEIVPYIGVGNIPLGSRILLDVRLQAELLSLILPDPSVVDSTAESVEWLPGARIDATAHGLMSGGTSQPIPLLDLASMKMSIDDVRGGLEWVRTQGIGYYIEANGFQFGGSMPDLSGFFAGLPSGFDLSLLDGLSWDGIDLHLPNGDFIRFSGPDWGYHVADGSGGWDLTIDFPDIDWTNFSIPGITLPSGVSLPNLNLSGFNGINGLDFNLRSLDGAFNFQSLLQLIFPNLDFSSSWNILDFLTLPQIRGLLGRFLSLRGGKFGLFLSGFFRIDVDLVMFDLGQFVSRTGEVNLPDFEWPNLPESWNISRGGTGGFGLGPFSIPLDWPEIDWDLLITNPIDAIRNFFIQLFTQIQLEESHLLFLH